MAAETGATATVTRPTDVGLKREMGLIGATWASETSIIGSGWLFGAWLAAAAAGTAALLGWVIAGIAIIILALVHAELGAMYPVAGGTARFPHYAYGSVAGISFGFFSWVQAVTVAPIECFAVMQYASYYWPSVYNTTTGITTGLGFALTALLLAIFTALNFFAMRLFSKVNSGITWWKVAIPIFTIIVLFTQFKGSNFGSHGGFMPYGVKALFGAIPSAGIVFAYLGFEQADQLAGEIKNPQRNLPRAIILAVLLGTADLRPAAGRLHRRADARPARPRLGRDRQTTRASSPGRSPSPRARSHWAGWRRCCGSTRSSPRSAPG